MWVWKGGREGGREEERKSQREREREERWKKRETAVVRAQYNLTAILLA